MALPIFTVARRWYMFGSSGHHNLGVCPFFGEVQDLFLARNDAERRGLESLFDGAGLDVDSFADDFAGHVMAVGLATVTSKASSFPATEGLQKTSET